MVLDVCKKQLDSIDIYLIDRYLLEKNYVYMWEMVFLEEQKEKLYGTSTMRNKTIFARTLAWQDILKSPSHFTKTKTFSFPCCHPFPKQIMLTEKKLYSFILMLP